jgi:hypothetical protein
MCHVTNSPLGCGPTASPHPFSSFPLFPSSFLQLPPTHRPSPSSYFFFLSPATLSISDSSLHLRQRSGIYIYTFVKYMLKLLYLKSFLKCIFLKKCYIVHIWFVWLLRNAMEIKGRKFMCYLPSAIE